MAAFLSAAVFWLAAALLAVAVAAGGSSQFGMMSTAYVELISLPVLGIAGWLAARRRLVGLRWQFAILLAGAAIAATQLIPVPLDLWRNLPGRANEVAAFGAAGGHPASLPASLAPAATVRSLLALLPGAAMFFGVSALDSPARRKLIWLLTGLGCVSALVGMAQATGRLASVYTVTNPGLAVGFFANRNHLASLLCACLPFAAALARPSSPDKARGIGKDTIAAAGIGAILLLGAAATGSRAGLLLAVFGLLGAAGIVWRGQAQSTSSRPWTPAVLAIGAVVMLAFLQFTRLSAFDRVGVVDEGRSISTATTLSVAKQYAPIGSGLGTFVPAYAAAEPPQTLTSAYFNHAHDDWAELWLEGGWPIAGVVICFVAWCATMAVRAWRPAPHGRGLNNNSLARPATLAIGLLLIHSAVDYPLRTTTMIAVFGLACALLGSPTYTPSPPPAGHRSTDAHAPRSRTV